MLGQLVGNVTVKEKFELRAGGSMQGNLKAPRIAMADGAIFSGKVEMPGAKAVPAAPASPAVDCARQRQKLEPRRRLADSVSDSTWVRPSEL